MRVAQGRYCRMAPTDAASRAAFHPDNGAAVWSPRLQDLRISLLPRLPTHHFHAPGMPMGSLDLSFYHHSLGHLKDGQGGTRTNLCTNGVHTVMTLTIAISTHGQSFVLPQ